MMKRLMTTIFVSAISAVSLAASAESNASDNNLIQAKQLVKQFSGILEKELKSALKEGGAANAVETCHLKAPDIPHDLSEKSHWTVRRTSLKVRDLENAPDKWELAVLEKFEQQNAEDVDDDVMEYSEITINSAGKKVFRYMKAIPARRICMKCHGENINSKVKKQLDSLYPFDQATGFTEDDLRGAFSLSKELGLNE